MGAWFKYWHWFISCVVQLNDVIRFHLLQVQISVSSRGIDGVFIKGLVKFLGSGLSKKLVD